MNLEDIQKLLASGKSADIRRVQRFLMTEGLLAPQNVTGVFDDRTITALGQYRTILAERQKSEAEQAKAAEEAARRQREEEERARRSAEEAEERAKKRKEREEFQNSWQGQALSLANSGPSFLAGTLTGGLTARGVDKVLSQRGSVVPWLKRGGRFRNLPNALARISPYAALGGTGIVKGQYLKEEEKDPSKTLFDRESSGAWADFFTGAGLGTLGGGLKYAAAAPPPPQPPSSGGIWSRLWGQKAAPDIPEKFATGAEAKKYLKGKGVPVSRMSAGEAKALAKKMARRVAGTGAAVALPVAVGLYAADAARSSAEARGLDDAEAAGNAVLAGGLAGGATYGAAKGTNYLLNTAARAAPVSARVIGRAIPPVAVGLTAYDTYNLLRDLARQSDSPAMQHSYAAEPFLSGEVVPLAATDEGDGSTRRRNMTPYRVARERRINRLARARFDPEYQAALDRLESALMSDDSTMAGF